MFLPGSNKPVDLLAMRPVKICHEYQNKLPVQVWKESG